MQSNDLTKNEMPRTQEPQFLNHGKINKTISNELNLLLANEYTLFTKTLNFHWNIVGPRFHSIHEFLETQYRDLLEIVDDLAERVRMVGGKAVGTIDEYARMSTLGEKPGVFPETNEMIGTLKDDHTAIIEQIGRILKEKADLIDSPGTEDFLTQLLAKHEEMTWMLNSHLH